MATAARAPARPHSEYHEATGVWSWLTTVDHKRIGALYLYTALLWFLVGGFEALILRMQLQGPNGR
jgi:cytochrome c oxidase subunit 1